MTIRPCSGSALLLKLVPGAQANGELIALVLPVHLAFAWGAYELRPHRLEDSEDLADAEQLDGPLASPELGGLPAP